MGILDSIEPLKDFTLVSRRNTYAVIADTDGDHFSRGDYLHIHSCCLRRILDRIGQQIGEHLAETIAVPNDVRVRGATESNSVGSRGLLRADSYLAQSVSTLHSRQ